MQDISITSKLGFRALIFLIKAYAVVGPFILVVLVDYAGFQGSTAMAFMTVGNFVAFLVLLFVGFSQLSSGLRKAAHSSFIYAGVALFWILIALFLLPSLAST
jgi:hypothetical protein